MKVYETFITFETAKLAKEKGFTLRNLGSHVYNYYMDSGEDGNISWDHLHIDSPAKSPQHLLQKWLRDEHGIHVFVDHAYDNFNSFSSEIHTLKVRNIVDGLTMWNTYELALEEGLWESLKLIKDV